MPCNIFYSFSSIVLLNLQNISNSLLYEQDIPKHVRYPAAGNVFIYIYLNSTKQILFLKTGCMVGLIA